MAAAASIATDWTVCTICLEMFDNPKALPCLHGFCLKCLQRYFKDNSPGNEVPCPLCRTKFKIPSDGLRALRHHFFIQHLVDARNAASKEQELIQLRASYCDKHKDKQVELYCYDCDENICLTCSAVKHRNHNSGEIPEVAGSFKPRIDEDDKRIVSAVNAVQQRSEKMKQHALEFACKVESVLKKVIEAGEAIKRLVDHQVSECIMELQSVKLDTDKQFEVVQEQLQLALVEMESFHTYSRELLDKGRPSDVTREASELHKRATELLDSDLTSVQYWLPHVTFSPAAQLTSFQLIGKLSTTYISNKEGNVFRHS